MRKKFVKKLVLGVLVINVFFGGIIPKVNAASNTITKKYSQIYGVINQTATQKSSTKYNNVLEKYVTDRWAKSSDYTLTQGKTSSLSFGGQATGDITDWLKGGFSLNASISSTVSVSTKIPANSKKNSKLAYTGDYYKKVFAVKKVLTPSRGPVTTLFNGDVIALEPVESYIKVVYQNEEPKNSVSGLLK